MFCLENVRDYPFPYAFPYLAVAVSIEGVILFTKQDITQRSDWKRKEGSNTMSTKYS